MSKLPFNQWFIEVEEEVMIQIAESGADRELDFNLERYFEDLYDKYYESDSPV